VFAGGDMVPATRLVTVGIGDGKAAARNIDAWLRRAPVPTQPQYEPAEHDTLHTWYYSEAPHAVRPRLRPPGAPPISPKLSAASTPTPRFMRLGAA
jgi:hypothetical protein